MLQIKSPARRPGWVQMNAGAWLGFTTSALVLVFQPGTNAGPVAVRVQPQPADHGRRYGRAALLPIDLNDLIKQCVNLLVQRAHLREQSADRQLRLNTL